MNTVTLIISDHKGASVVAGVTRVSLSQDTGLIGYIQALPHAVTDGGPLTEESRIISSVSYEIANGDVLVLEDGKLIAHLVTGPEAVKFRPGGKLADEKPTVPMFIGPAEPKGHPDATKDSAIAPSEEGE